MRKRFQPMFQAAIAGLRQPKRRRCGFTIIELLVAIGIISILAALLLPAVQQARASARRIQCMNHVRNLSLAMLQVVETSGRFPASGNWGVDPLTGKVERHHSWAVDVLPWLEQADVASQWDKNKPAADPSHQTLVALSLPVLTCPDDISVQGKGDMSYVVNGGIGHTIERAGVPDCPVDRTGQSLDLNGNGITCPTVTSADGTPSDKRYFKMMGLFFPENWNLQGPGATVRFHRPQDVADGTSNTLMISENVRTGFDPANPDVSWATANFTTTSFFIGNPCGSRPCVAGSVDYSRSNAGSSAINSGLDSPEGTSPVPNSFHGQGVNMAFADGHVIFMADFVDGAVYAALASPRGQYLPEPLEQTAELNY